jgi:hypothetical protein
MYSTAIVVFDDDTVIPIVIKNPKILDFFERKKTTFSTDWNEFPPAVADIIKEKRLPFCNMAYVIFLNIYVWAGEEKREDVFNFLQAVSRLGGGLIPRLFLF